MSRRANNIHRAHTAFLIAFYCVIAPAGLLALLIAISEVFLWDIWPQN